MFRSLLLPAEGAVYDELVGIDDIPLPREEGWTRHQEKWCEATPPHGGGDYPHDSRLQVETPTPLHFFVCDVFAPSASTD